jgi:hypothetical protein
VIATVGEVKKWLDGMPDDATVFVESSGNTRPVVMVGADMPYMGRFKRVIFFGAESMIPGVRYE